MMDLFCNLLEKAQAFSNDGVAQSVLVLSLVIVLGIMLSKVKVCGISLGGAWILFVGIAFGHFQLSLDGRLLHFLKEFGLILFVYSIGLQVGPGFFSAFRKGGLTLNVLAVISILCSVAIAVVFHFVTDIPTTAIVGILSGAVTNTPGLGAAQQAYSDIHGMDAPEIATGYAVAYPLGAAGTILTLIALKHLFRINKRQEEDDAEKCFGRLQELSVCSLSLEILNEAIDGKRIKDVCPLLNRRFVISRISPHRDSHRTHLVNSETILRLNDKILLVTSPADMEAVSAFFGKETHVEWEQPGVNLMAWQILVTKPELQGKTLAELDIRKHLAVSITRINRSGIDLVAAPKLHLQMGDRVTVVGMEQDIEEAEKMLGNSVKKLNTPNLLPVFLGIAAGCLLGSIPMFIPGMPRPVKLGLAGGPLVVSILLSYFGPKYKIVTYATTSANLMLREIGISLFLACVGLEAGKNFIPTLMNGDGLQWMACGMAITVFPLLVAGIVGRFVFQLNYYTLIGVLSGANTNPPALAYSNEQTSSDAPAVGYATVYPLAMFLRILSSQLLIFM